jgi:hypothetical protein
MDEKAAYTKAEFCAAHSISRSKLYAMPRPEWPDLMWVDGMERISFESAARWRREREAASRARLEAAELEAAE